jgi:Protein of unknown function (DUF4232)
VGCRGATKKFTLTGASVEASPRAAFVKRLMLTVALAVGLSVPSAEAASLPQPIHFWGSIAAPVTASYNPVVIRPSTIGLFRDGSWFLEHLHWTGWGSSVARAKGISNASNGNPSQAQGKRIMTSAQVTLYNPGRFEDREVYRCFKLTVPPPAHIGPLCLVGGYVPPPSTQPSASPSCASRQLLISLGAESAASGHLAIPIRFHDRGETCSLRGYPPVDGLSASGRVVVRAKPALTGYFGSWSIATITLKNGQTASALLVGVDPTFFAPPPPSARRLRVTPPNASHSVLLRAPYPLADLTIHPVVAGQSGTGR